MDDSVMETVSFSFYHNYTNGVTLQVLHFMHITNKNMMILSERCQIICVLLYLNTYVWQYLSAQ